MRDLIPDLDGWYRDGARFALATVIDTFRSAPRPAGASMAVSSGGEVIGSVSGGCVEGAVYELALEVIESGRPVVQRYGVSDDDAFAAGLTCGGIIDILVQAVDAASFPEFEAVIRAIEQDRPIAVGTMVSPTEDLGRRLIVSAAGADGGLGNHHLDAAVADDATAMLEQGATAVRNYGPRGERRLEDVGVFVQSFAPPPRMFVFGAIDFAAAVARIGKFLGYNVTVCDGRPVFATAKRFPDADEVVAAWPHRHLAEAVKLGQVDASTALCVLTHDPKFDVPLLELALRTDAGFVGAMGSRRTHEDRRSQLLERGLTEAELDRLASPIGLDLGGRTPEETAVSIAAQIIASRSGGSGRPLSAVSGRIHGETPALARTS